MKPICIFLAGLLLATGAAAQEKPASDIIVTARKPIDAPVARRFVRNITALTQDQIARFDAPVCPIAIGFEPEIEKQLVARMRRVAKAVGAELAPEHCAGNVALVTTDDGGALVKALRSTHPNLLEGLEPRQIDRMIKSQGPVRSWSATAVVNEDGQRMSPPTSGDFMDPPTLVVKTASFVNPSSQQIIDCSTVVIDAKAVIGRSAIQLADYAMMRALARTRPVTGDSDVGTILSLFDPDSASALSVTDADVAYLKALYAMPGNRTATYQMARIAGQLKQVSAPSVDKGPERYP
jgi:hypothetical protein